MTRLKSNRKGIFGAWRKMKSEKINEEGEVVVLEEEEDMEVEEEEVGNGDKIRPKDLSGEEPTEWEKVSIYKRKSEHREWSTVAIVTVFYLT